MSNSFRADENKIFNKLIEIRQEILLHADDIILHLLPIMNENNLNFSSEYKKDIKNIYDSTISLKKKLLNLLSNEKLIEKKKLDLKFNAYLADVRHDLRDSINAIQGYTEIGIEEFTGSNTSSDFKKLFSINLLILKILNLIDQIKFVEAISEILPVPDSLHLSSLARTNDMSEKEYNEFKEQFSILIVDDIKENCQILERNLTNIGYKKIKISNNGVDALAMIRKEKIDLVLLDINMPGMSGLELLETIKFDILNRKIMVVIITGADAMQNAVKCIQYGAEDIILKPFNADLLRVRINACFEKKMFITIENKYHEDLERERMQYLQLLHAVFPPVIVDELLQTGHVQARNYTNVAILFVDVVNFTDYCEVHSLDEIIKNIQEFAEICEMTSAKYNLQKIKTIGDGYLAIAGMLTKHDNPVLDCVKCAEEIFQQSAHLQSKWQLHSAIDYGNVIGGIVGHHQYLFDIWSDTVNTAAHLQGLAEPNSLYLTKAAWEQIKNDCECHSLGKYLIKGKKQIEIYQFIEHLNEK